MNFTERAHVFSNVTFCRWLEDFLATVYSKNSTREVLESVRTDKQQHLKNSRF